ncbi:MAG: phosphotransferase [Elusimicrobia bacterium]|nr:phosphotransferase [Elusimicrobiota bacterium]
MRNPRLDAAIADVPGWSKERLRINVLKGGLTNRNFKIEAEDGAFVLKLDGKETAVLGIDRKNENTCASIAAGLGVGPQVYHYLPAERSFVTRFIEGEPVSPQAASQPAMLKRIVASIKRVHEGPAFPGRFSPFETVRHYRRAAWLRRATPPEAIDLGLIAMGRIEQILGRRQNPKPCHNDLLASNFIDDGKTIRIVDWEYAAMGDPLFDLGNFAVNQQLSEDRCRLLLKAYFAEVRPDALARLQLYRLMSDLREALWGFLQSRLSDIKFDFEDYGINHLDRFLRGASGPRFERWLKEAA